jgi:hypothetical protein
MFHHGSGSGEYGAPVSRPSLPRSAGRFAIVALAGAFTISACSVLPTGLALAPGSTPPAEVIVVASPDPVVGATQPPAREPATPATDAGSPVEAPRADEAPARAEPKLTVVRLKPRPRPGPFRMNLYRKGDFVHQATKDWCVAGSTATMMNIIDRGSPHGSVKGQQRLYQRGRKLSPMKRKLGAIGVDLIGWEELLNRGGYGPYVVASSNTRRGAIRKAARAIRKTGRPVGLVTWRGAHSWVMSGFAATADPAFSNDFRVKAVNIQDTWYPFVSTIWGASRPPNALVPVAALREDYLRYARPRARYPKRDGKFMLILPVLPEGTVVR